ncbi:MAG: hypothetical protein CMH49_09110 [Myxococcales bacterium]|nr:hypothetical protein [Myxococcales bacterium]
MLITLITIAIASLVATPLVAPAVRRLANRDSRLDTKIDSKTQDLALEEPSINELNESLTHLDTEHLPISTQVVPVIPQFSLELIKPSPTSSPSTQQSTKHPLVEVVWKTSSTHRTQANSQRKKDLVEDFRETPSADRLFEDSNQEAQLFESANKADPPRLIMPKPIGGQPKAARQIKPIKFEESSIETAVEPSSLPISDHDQRGSVKRYQVGAEKFKMNPVASSGSIPRSKPSAIPMFISTTPSLVNNEQHFEVIKPQKTAKKAHSFSLLDQPEQFASGEKAWLGVQPLYIDFSPFFSLDSLMEMSSYTQERSSKSHSLKKSARVSRSSSPNKRQKTNQGAHMDSILGGFEHIELLRDLNSEMDHYLHSTYDDFDEDEEEYEWNNHQQDEAHDELEELPEWQSLLGLSNHFLFDMKLNQKRMAQHQELTDQKLEDAIVFKITSGVSGPVIQNTSQKKNE